ncbi:phage holin family protein [Erythrobacter insulae]|uniref:Phage holin family protein n=1 Tax=Erythrobacter insulae TaxID=2584124 RepID=A0A547P707_9SPHN|nr:phage holin family protein [Erythrobacter insulae]TRD09915.1 phage holin family protein [Erythrobacter insulae]
MRDNEMSAGKEHDALDPSGSHGADTAPTDSDPAFDESLTDEIAALINDGRTYAEAELVFQKTRAVIAGKSIGFAIGYVLVALVTLHIAVLALAVGLVIALEPLATIWGAIAIVVGALIVLTAFLVFAAKKHADRIGLMFGSAGQNNTAEKTQ